MGTSTLSSAEAVSLTDVGAIREEYESFESRFLITGFFDGSGTA